MALVQGGTSGEALSPLMLEILRLCHPCLLGLPGAGSSSPGQPRIPAAAASLGDAVRLPLRAGAGLPGAGGCVGGGCLCAPLRGA